jgi:hypothetical protein
LSLISMFIQSPTLLVQLALIALYATFGNAPTVTPRLTGQ